MDNGNIRRGWSITRIVLLIIVVGALIFAGWVLIHPKPLSDANKSTAITATTTPTKPSSAAKPAAPAKPTSGSSGSSTTTSTTSTSKPTTTTSTTTSGSITTSTTSNSSGNAAAPQLVNTGPGQVVGLFAVSVVAATIVGECYVRRRATKSL